MTLISTGSGTLAGALAPYVTVKGPKKWRLPPEAMDLRGTRSESQIPALFPQRFPVNSHIAVSGSALGQDWRGDFRQRLPGRWGEFDFGGCGGPQSPKSNCQTFRVDVIWRAPIGPVMKVGWSTSPAEQDPRLLCPGGATGLPPHSRAWSSSATPTGERSGAGPLKRGTASRRRNAIATIPLSLPC